MAPDSHSVRPVLDDAIVRFRVSLDVHGNDSDDELQSELITSPIQLTLTPPISEVMLRSGIRGQNDRLFAFHAVDTFSTLY